MRGTILIPTNDKLIEHARDTMFDSNVEAALVSALKVKGIDELVLELGSGVDASEAQSLYKIINDIIDVAKTHKKTTSAYIHGSTFLRSAHMLHRITEIIYEPNNVDEFVKEGNVFNSNILHTLCLTVGQMDRVYRDCYENNLFLLTNDIFDKRNFDQLFVYGYIPDDKKEKYLHTDIKFYGYNELFYNLSIYRYEDGKLKQHHVTYYRQGMYCGDYYDEYEDFYQPCHGAHNSNGDYSNNNSSLIKKEKYYSVDVY